MYDSLRELLSNFENYENDDIIIITDVKVMYIRSEVPYENGPNKPKAKIPKDSSTLGKIIHVAHDKVRFKRINDISKRMKPGPYATHHWSAGDPFLEGVQYHIPFVRSLPEFCTPYKSCTDPTKLYVYLMPNNKWGFFTVN